MAPPLEKVRSTTAAQVRPLILDQEFSKQDLIRSVQIITAAVEQAARKNPDLKKQELAKASVRALLDELVKRPEVAIQFRPMSDWVTQIRGQKAELRGRIEILNSEAQTALERARRVPNSTTQIQEYRQGIERLQATVSLLEELSQRTDLTEEEGRSLQIETPLVRVEIQKVTGDLAEVELEFHVERANEFEAGSLDDKAAEEFRAAIVAIDILIPMTTGSDRTAYQNLRIFYAARIHFFNKEFDRSIELLKQYQRTATPRDKKQADFHIGFALLEKGAMAEAAHHFRASIEGIDAAEAPWRASAESMIELALKPQSNEVQFEEGEATETEPVPGNLSVTERNSLNQVTGQDCRARTFGRDTSSGNGKIGFEFIVNPEGAVEKVAPLAGATIDHPRLQQCLLDGIRRKRFEPRLDRTKIQHIFTFIGEDE